MNIYALYGIMSDMSRQDEIRLMSKIARMYYVQGIRQKGITDRLQLHQSTVSRLLKRAREVNMVRFSVTSPPGIFSDLEDQLSDKFALKDAVVIDGSVEEEPMVRDLGAATAYYLETTLKPGTKIGISSWSRSLFAMVGALHPGDYCKDGKVVQMVGGVGNVGVHQEAMNLAQRLAITIGATPVPLQAPAIVASAEARRILAREPFAREAAETYKKIGKPDLAIVGIGSMEPSRLLARSGNVFSPLERAELSRLGAVGEICFKYFDAQGAPIKSPLMQRVVGIELAHLKSFTRVIGVAGGKKKTAAILAALRGGWIDVLITDRRTGEALLSLHAD